MKDYVCTHCGGKISIINMRCEYCGTQYKIEHDQILRIETYSNPVETFGNEVERAKRLRRRADKGEQE